MIEYWLDAEQTALAALVYARNQLLKLRSESSEQQTMQDMYEETQ